MPRTIRAPRRAEKPIAYARIRTTKEYQDLLNVLYGKAKRDIVRLELPATRVIAVDGTEPPSGKQYGDAIAVLYGLAYTLKMGLKFGKLRPPKGYFDYSVGALETLWWSTGPVFDIANAATLRWKAYLMVPPFVTPKLLEEAREMAKSKKPEVPYDKASLEAIDEGTVVQALHVGPYNAEGPTIERLHEFMAEHGLVMAGRHHEIYISDPRRTKPASLKTVIRIPIAKKQP